MSRGPGGGCGPGGPRGCGGGRSKRRRAAQMVAALLGALVSGCAAFGPPQPVGLVERIEGVAAITYDGLDLVVEKQTQGGGANWTLIGPLGVADVAILRLGKEFALTDGGTFFTVYRVMSLSEELIGLHKTTRRNRAAEGAAVREQAAVIHVRPYDE